ncbi:MAG: DUF5616 domain-containing protein, partial [Thaumarchaeota archaeon]|nr:DUF5616 domain-containing protein [Nitrososphaerota archaeon]
FYESQISRSGEIASLTRRMMANYNLVGTARTLKTVDSFLARSDEIIATSDSIILLRCRSFIDIPRNLDIVERAEIIRLD